MHLVAATTKSEIILAGEPRPRTRRGRQHCRTANGKRSSTRFNDYDLTRLSSEKPSQSRHFRSRHYMQQPLATLRVKASGRRKRFIPRGKLRRRILQHTLSRFQLTGPVTIPIAPPALRTCSEYSLPTTDWFLMRAGKKGSARGPNKRMMPNRTRWRQSEYLDTKSSIPTKLGQGQRRPVCNQEQRMHLRRDRAVGFLRNARLT